MRTSTGILLALAAIAAVFPAGGSRAADEALIAAAKKEGSVTWYTTQIVNQFVAPAAEAFNRKYGIKVDYIRNTANDLTRNLMTEARAGKVHGDVFDGTTAAAVLKKENIVLKWQPDNAGRFDAQYRDRDGYWVATNVYILTPGVNTSMVPSGTEPRTFADLLDPKWKGRIVWNSSPSTSGAGGFIGLVLAAMGEQKGMEYLRRLSGQNITGILNAPRAGLDAVMTGEYPLALNIFNNHTIISRAQGAPVQWVKMNDPVLAVMSVVAVTRAAPHPNAARLLVDFLVSEDGQRLFQKANYIPVDPKVPPNDPGLRPDTGKFRAIYFTPEQVASLLPGWMKIYRDVFR